MSDALEIRAGGAVAVDTASIRAAADGFDQARRELAEVLEALGAVTALCAQAGGLGESPHVRGRGLLRTAEVIDGDAVAISSSLRAAAAVYEIVELRAERGLATAAGDCGAVARIDARVGVLMREHPDAGPRAASSEFAHWLTWPGELAGQAAGALWWLAPGFHSLSIPMAWALQRAIGTMGAGTVPSTARLRGSAPEVTVSSLPLLGPATAPSSLADAATRLPGGGDARIRIERYTMTDGSRQFAVYVAGTQTVAPGTRDPFDMDSNVELYTGERSASYEATLAALAAAGAEDGDVVHAFGHSQGAMVAARVALEGGFETQTLVSFGSPIEAAVGRETLSISLRHTDDPVAALAGGGHARPVGAPGSFIAERTADPQPGLHDYRLPAHGIEGYTQTARMLDASEDARMAAVRQLFDELGGAASVDVTEYSAQRAVVVPQPRPGPAPFSPSSDAG